MRARLVVGLRCDCPTLQRSACPTRPACCGALLAVMFLVAAGLLHAADATTGKDKPAGLKKKSSAETAPSAATSALVAERGLLPWIEDFDTGLARALVDRKPILVRVVGNGCPWCRKLEEEMGKPEVQKELGRWTLVHVNQDRAPDQADELGVGAVPALRVLTAGGQWIASTNGYLGRQELVAFLHKHLPAAAAAPGDELVATTVPNAVAVIQLVGHFDERSPTIREAAVRRLLPHPVAARGAVVKAFREGSLSARLAALELLEAWKAPVQSLDPWRPETFTAESLATLEKWREQSPPNSAAAEKLSAEQLAAARRDMDQMLRGTAAEAEAIRERLTRLRHAAVAETVAKEVAARLQRAAGDEERRRLLALKYRLAASDALALRWPGGLMRLAATDSRQRQAAAEELVGRASADDQTLLLELFADPDPLVRETSLRGLQAIGGKEATAALVKLLDDPEPNVRAAVLKQLTEAPLRSLVPRVAAYVAKESDADLVVHAIRFLLAARGQQSARCLMSLLSHRQWQVRAEAAESLGKILKEGRNSVPLELRADSYVALIRLLDDNDAFVVSRVVDGLSGVDSDVAVEPLIRAAGKHPDLMPKIVEILANNEKVRAKALPHLRAFARHKDPTARAAALKGLVEAVPDEIEEELSAGLQSSEVKVRMAAAAALFRFFERLRSDPQELAARKLSDRLDAADRPASVPAAKSAEKVETPPSKSPPNPKTAANLENAAEARERPDKGKPAENAPDDDGDRWLTRFYRGGGRPKWMAKLVGPLGKMLAAEAAEERVEAAVSLVPMGQVDRALRVLIDTVSAHPDLLKRAREVLPWLLWDKRLETFRRLQPLAGRDTDRLVVLQAMTESPDRRAAELFWQLLAEPKVSAESAVLLYGGLRSAYYRESPHRRSDKVPSSYRRELAQAAKARVDAEGQWTPLAALLLLADAAPEEAAAVATRIAADGKRSEELRIDAFQVSLVVQPRGKAMRAALAGVKESNLERRKRALAYLVDGPVGLGTFRKQFYLSTSQTSGGFGDGQSGAKSPPAGVTVEHLRPLLESSDAQTAAYAGYLAALLGEAKGLPAVLRYWQQEGEKSHGAERLVYTAIAALDDSTQIHVLRRIAEGLQPYEMRDFYWTIRSMSGPEILKFRKEIRDKAGMDNLR